VVDETVQPTRVWLWLHSPATPQLPTRSGDAGPSTRHPFRAGGEAWPPPTSYRLILAWSAVFGLSPSEMLRCIGPSTVWFAVGLEVLGDR
jgi:hypothetical protein